MFCSKKISYIICSFFLIFAIYLIDPIYSKAQPSRGREFQPADSEISFKKGQVRRLIEQRKKEGVDVSEALSLLEQSRIAIQRGEKKECLRLLDNAIALLGEKEFTKQTQRESVVTTKNVEKIVELPVGSAQVEVTELVPNLTSGRDIGTYTATLFKSYSLSAEKGKVPLSVGSIPLFVREIVNQKDSRQTKQSPFNCKDSPFGIHDIDKFDDRLVDLGACWVRHAGLTALVWDIAEREKGKFDWSRTDTALNDTYRNNIHMVVVINSFNHWDQGRERGPGSKKLVKDIEAYQSFLQKAVKRYPFVNAWQIENEPNYQRLWADTPENYLTLMKVSYQAIKRANPDALVVIGGVSDPNALSEGFWPEIFQQLDRWKGKERYFDAFDAHWFLHQDKYTEDIAQLTPHIQKIRKKLSEVGHLDAPIWISEMASYSGSPIIVTRSGLREKNMPKISEKQQASDLVKLYVHALSLGVSKIFWVRLIEWSGFNIKNAYFDNTGLINNPLNDGESHKKLSYYSYKKLVEILKGMDLKIIETLSLREQVHTYRFLKNGESIYIVWAGD
jgi:hypothetical protein